MAITFFTKNEKKCKNATIIIEFKKSKIIWDIPV